MSTDKPFVFDLVVGDHSCDGHEQTEIFKISCNLNHVELLKAYTAGVKVAGFSIEKLCQPAKENTIKAGLLQRLIELGLTEWVAGEDMEDEIEIYPENYAELWLFTAKLGNPALQYELAPREFRLPIGGYGVFYLT